ncbi:phosphotransferase family protein [Streptomyces sp. NPDC050485]|uniref:phosphotransferase family protein n=1 Tax=Streptomyces sp. NPDC050485 TaxID=3365617 RepID=UPI0037A3BF1B
MYSPPTDPQEEQAVRQAFDACCDTLGLGRGGEPVWGFQGRTLSGAVNHPEHGMCWLRVVHAPMEKAQGKHWEGNAFAARFDGRVQKPRLYETIEFLRDSRAFQGELGAFIAEPMCSKEPVLREGLELPDSWWASLRADLATVASTKTSRQAVRQEWVDRCVPEFLGIEPPQITEWETAHGDLHPANLTLGTPYLLDWEGFGLAPVGYDPAMLLAYCGLVPTMAERVRHEFPILDDPAGRTARIVVATELLQSVSRGDHPELEPSLRALALGPE